MAAEREHVRRLDELNALRVDFSAMITHELGAPIEIHAAGKNKRVRIEVSDHGWGIHPEDLSRIFEKFGRDLESRKVSGVGLYLSQRIVRSHGSDLTVHTNLDEGSVFGFELATWQSIVHRPMVF